MENIKTCELCFKQIIKTEDFENFNCDEKQNLQILQNLKITVGRDAKICSDCVNISHLTYNFKTYCLTNNDHLKTLIRPGINDKLILEEVVVEKNKREFKNEKVCRFCLNFFELNSLVEINLEQDVVLKDMLGRCLPEIDTKFVQNPLMCFICNKLLKKLYNFISQCKDTEVFRNLDPKTDVIVNEIESTLTVENNDKNINESFVKEENCDGIENPELQIKSENFDIKEDIKDSIKKSNSLLKEGETQAEPFSCPSEYESNLVRHKKNHERACGNCEEEKVELYKCTMCSFTTSNKCEIVEHKKKGHKDRKQGLGNLIEEKDMKPKPRGTIKKKQFICDICSYQTTRSYRLKQHYLIHKEPSEVNLFKCDYCPYATKWKCNLTSHTMRHINPSELPKFKCNDCPYETSKKTSLFRHVFVHKNPSQVNMYKCKVCPYQTMIRDYLQKHQKRHQAEVYTCYECNYKVKSKKSFILHLRDHKEGKQPVKKLSCGTITEKKFVCGICSYQTTRNNHLKQHYLIHKEPSVVNLFKCDYCPYVTKWKCSLTSHTMRHMNPSELPKFKCNDCPYETSNKTNLLRHVFVHKDPSQVNMYKCIVCPYQTKERRYLQRHQKRHQAEIYTCDECNYKVKSKISFILHLRDHKEGNQLVKKHTTKLFEDFTVKLSRGTIKEKKFVCDICLYQTTRNSNLQQHYLIHKKPSEVNLFKCDYCPFATKWKHCLIVHTIRHKNPSELPKFKCNDCPYETIKKRNLVRHVLVHKNPLQLNMYKCKVCPYQTKERRYLQQHQKRHLVEIYTFDECNYKTKSNESFNLHLPNHNEEKQPAKSN